MKFEAYFEVLYPFWVIKSQTFEGSPLFVLAYHWLPLATSNLVGDNREFEVWGIFWGHTPIFMWTSLKILISKLFWKEFGRLGCTQMDGSGYHSNNPFGYIIIGMWLTFTVHFRGFQRLEGASSFVILGWVIMCDFIFERTESQDFTITIYMNQHVEFFYSLIFSESLQSVATSQRHSSHTIVALRVTTHVNNKQEIGYLLKIGPPPPLQCYTIRYNVFLFANLIWFRCRAKKVSKRNSGLIFNSFKRNKC